MSIYGTLSQPGERNAHRMPLLGTYSENDELTIFDALTLAEEYELLEVLQERADERAEAHAAALTEDWCDHSDAGPEDDEIYPDWVGPRVQSL